MLRDQKKTVHDHGAGKQRQLMCEVALSQFPTALFVVIARIRAGGEGLTVSNCAEQTVDQNVSVEAYVAFP